MYKNEIRLESERKINALKINLRQITAEYARGTMRDTTRKARRWLLLFSFVTLLWCFKIEFTKIAIGGAEIGGSVQELIPVAVMGLTVYFLVLFVTYMKSDAGYFEYLNNEKLIIMTDINRTLSEMGFDPLNLNKNDMTLLPIGKIDEETESYCQYQDGYLVRINKNLQPVVKANKLRIFVDYYFPIFLASCAIIVFTMRYFLNWP